MRITNCLGYDGHVSVEAMTGLCRAPRLEQIPTGSLPGTGPDRRTRPAVWGMRVCTTAAKQGCGGRQFSQNILWSSGSAAQHNLVVDPPTIKFCAIHRIDWLLPVYWLNWSAKGDEVLKERVSTVKFNCATENVTDWVIVCLVADQRWE